MILIASIHYYLLTELFNSLLVAILLLLFYLLSFATCNILFCKGSVDYNYEWHGLVGRKTGAGTYLMLNWYEWRPVMAMAMAHSY